MRLIRTARRLEGAGPSSLLQPHSISLASLLTDTLRGNQLKEQECGWGVSGLTWQQSREQKELRDDSLVTSTGGLLIREKNKEMGQGELGRGWVTQ